MRAHRTTCAGICARRFDARRSAGACRRGPALAALVLAALGAATAPAQEPEAQGAAQAAFAELEASAGRRTSGSFPFDFQHLAFFPNGPDGVELWTAASVHAGRVRGVFEGGWVYRLAMRVELTRDGEVVASDETRIRHALNVLIPPHSTDGFPIQTRVVVPPGRYDYRIELQDLNWEGDRSVNAMTGTVTVPPFESGRPFLSSIAVAADSGGAWRPAPGVTLKLNAAKMVQTDARPFVYFEVYGLTPGGTFRGDVRLVSTWVSRGKGETFDGVWQPFTLQYRASAPEEEGVPVRAVLRLDMQDTRPGPYEVRVRVTDVATGLSSDVRKAGVFVREPEDRGAVQPIEEVGQDRGDGGGGER
jgi:hypothetical protein